MHLNQRYVPRVVLNLMESDPQRSVAFSAIQNIESGVNELRMHQIEDLSVINKPHVMILFYRDSDFV
jgi:hypothetical protein